MAYGDKRGFKAPGEYKAGDLMGLILASAAGIISALVADYQQQGEGSALFTINQWVVSAGSMVGFTDIPLWAVVVGLTIIGAGSVFYFQPITRQGAYAQGFGLLAVLVTMVPGDFAQGLDTINSDVAARETFTTVEASSEPRIIKASYSLNVEPNSQAQIVPVHAVQSASQFDLHLAINFANGVPENFDRMIRRGAIRGRLHNEETGETWNLFRSTGGAMRKQGNTIMVNAGVPAGGDEARLWVRIEVAGYRIEEQSLSAMLGQQIDWTVDLEPSNTPLFVQRLTKSYWF